jgi:hypothetical protein
MPAYDTQTIGNALKWGLVYDTPNSLVWEIGHTSPFTQPASQFCLPGSATKPPCYSYNLPSWLGFSPLLVKSVTFGDGSAPQHWAAVSDYGGEAEVNQYCGAANYGQPFCVYPWYAYSNSTKTFTYGGDYPGSTKDFSARRCNSRRRRNAPVHSVPTLPIATPSCFRYNSTHWHN